MSNTFGTLLRLTTFGESHGAAIGGIVDGFPSGVEVDLAFVQSELNRRRPGQSHLTTARNEADEVEFLSGIFEGKTTGSPIAFMVKNRDQRSEDYEALRHQYRPSHADYTFEQKYGHRDHRGGGRQSARITLSRVVAGALAKLVLRQMGISVQAYTSQIGTVTVDKPYTELDLQRTENNAVRCPEPEKAAQMEALIGQMKTEGDTIGGCITCVVKGCPVGIGEPEFGKLHAQLGAAMLSINAVKAFEYGSGFDGCTQRGTQQNDLFVTEPRTSHLAPRTSSPRTAPLRTQTNHSGGIQGGISNGEDIYFRVGFKPIATLPTVPGRHDPCAVPRAVPIVEAMAALVVLDNLLIHQSRNTLLRDH